MRGFPMSDGSVLVLVIGQVRTPCGRVVQREYHMISRHEYYRLARTDRDTVGRPSCRTDAGRVAYGGGGIYPDILLNDRPPTPRWLARINEQQLILAWSGSYVDAGRVTGELESFAKSGPLPASAVSDFVAFAGKQGVEVPSDANAVLEPELRRAVAYAKWGTEGAYRADAAVDNALQQAMLAFAEANKLQGSPR